MRPTPAQARALAMLASGDLAFTPAAWRPKGGHPPAAAPVQHRTMRNLVLLGWCRLRQRGGRVRFATLSAAGAAALARSEGRL